MMRSVPQPLMSERAFVVAHLSELSYFQNYLRATTRERMSAEQK
jgi:7,8-dihydro-6-hydroxymethylpterin-pyrophosphokinase